jgi:hypothetical protein
MKEERHARVLTKSWWVLAVRGLLAVLPCVSGLADPGITAPMLGVCLGATHQALMQHIKKKNEPYARFRSSQAFRDLDSKVQKFEQWKKEPAHAV